MSSQRKELTNGTFNVRGLAKEEKQERLAQDIDNYKIDVCCLQETKIKDGRDITIGEKQHTHYHQTIDITEMDSLSVTTGRIIFTDTGKYLIEYLY